MDRVFSHEEFNDVMVAQYNINQGILACAAYSRARKAGTIMLHQAVADLSNTELATATFAVLAAKTEVIMSHQRNVADLKEKFKDREKYMQKVGEAQDKILSRWSRRLSLLDPEEASEIRTVLKAMLNDKSYQCKNVISINGFYESTLPQRVTQNGNITTPEALSITSSPGTSHETSPARSLEESLRHSVRPVMEMVNGEMSSSESSRGKSSPTDHNGIDLNSEPILATNGCHDVITINDNNRMDACVGRPIKSARRRINKAQTATAEESKIRKASQSENTPEPEAVTILPTPASEVEEVTEVAMETSVVAGEIDTADANTEEETVIEYDHEKPYLARVKATDNVELIHESLAETRQRRTQTNRPEVMQTGVYDRKNFLWYLHLMPTESTKEYAAKGSECQNAQMNPPWMTRSSNAGVTGACENHEVSSKRKRHSYLQSLGSALQTHQTTARLNGPVSPPPRSHNNNSTTSCNGIASKSPSLIKPTVGRPPIMRNGDVPAAVTYPHNQRHYHHHRQQQQQVKREPENNNNKPEMDKQVHIPGLPSSLTIERIENDLTVCIVCRNPGTLTECEYCSAKFHISCHTSSPGSSSYCPKCANRFRSRDGGINSSDLEILGLEMRGVKKEKDIATAAYATRAAGRAGEDAEIHKTAAGLCTTDAAQAAVAVGRPATILTSINQLPSSTFLTTAGTAALGSTAASTKSEQQQQQPSILLNQLSQPSLVTASTTGEPRLHGDQSFLVVEKLSTLTSAALQPLRERRWSSDKATITPKPGTSVLLESGKQSRLTFTTSENNSSGGYVTVEVRCSSNNNGSDSRMRAISEAPDCVYVTEESAPADLAVFVREGTENAKPATEPEVFNISSGSSGIEIVESPQFSVGTEHLDASIEQPTAAECIADDDIDDEDENNASNAADDDNDHGMDDDDDDDGEPDYHWEDYDYFGSVFPGKFGYKIRIVFESDSESEAESELESQSDERHVKLEEAHLPAPPAVELVFLTEEAMAVDDDDGDDDGDDEAMEATMAGSFTTVPDNKSDNDDDDGDDGNDTKQDCDSKEPHPMTSTSNASTD